MRRPILRRRVAPGRVRRARVGFDAWTVAALGALTVTLVAAIGGWFGLTNAYRLAAVATVVEVILWGGAFTW